MKKMLLMVAVVATVGLTSCGGADVCECMNEKPDEQSEACKELAKEWEEKMEKAESDEDKAKVLEEMTDLTKDCKKDEKEEK